MENQYLLGAGQIFTLFFIMVGPLKMIGPFFKATKDINSSVVMRKLSFLSFLLAAVIFVICGYLGAGLMVKWNISVPIMTLTAGLVFGYVAFRMILGAKKENEAAPENESPPEINPVKVAGSMIVSPYGMATLIVFLASSQSVDRTFLIFGMLAFVLLLDLLSMLFIRQIMGKIGSLVLTMLGFALGILQAALGMEIIYTSLQMLKIVA